MNVDEIVKALKCTKNQHGHCQKCRYAVFSDGVLDYCDTERLEMVAADLIEHQQSDLTSAHARIAELEMEAKGLRANSAIQEQIIKGGRNPFDKDTIIRLILEKNALQAHNKEAMELLALAVGNVNDLALSIREWGDIGIEPCGSCMFSPENTDAIGECPGYETNNCYRWQHTDRYEALKAQEGGLNGLL